MEKKRAELKKYFKTGDKPTESQFGDLIDSFLSIKEDGITVGSTKNIGIGTTEPKNKLDVKGNASIGTGYAGIENASPNGLIVEGKLGIGTADPLSQLHVEGEARTSMGLSINEKKVIDPNGAWVGDPTNLEGPAGAQGSIGPKGDQGQQGIAGQDGLPGSDGVPGQDGTAGTFLPPGVIVPFGGSAVPSEWLACDGTTYKKSEYSALSKTIGALWGTSKTSEFKVPDLRGRFLRGWDQGAGVDPDVKGRIGGNKVGSTQEDQLQSHKHELNDPGHNHEFNRPINNSGGGGANWANFSTPDGQGGSYVASVEEGFTKIGIKETGGSETRPKNVYVNYIIKT